MKALQNLVRLHRWQLDEKRRQLTQLESLRVELGRQEARLAEELAGEQEAAGTSTTAAMVFPAYLQEVRARQKRLGQSMREIERQVEAAQQEIADAYGELKKYEIALANLEKREHTKRERAQQIAQDDLAIDIYRRKRRG